VADAGRSERRARARLSRGQTAFYGGLLGGAVGMAAGTRLRRVFGRRGAVTRFEGTPCSTLPAEGGGDPVPGPADDGGDRNESS